MLVALVLTAAGGNETPHSLPFPAPVFGLIAFGVLLLLLAITWAFRSVGKRH